MRLFTRWLGASGPCDWMTSLPLSFLPVKKAWWVKLSGRNISQSAVARLSPRSTWWARRLNMTPVWPRWPHWATASLATDLSPSPITGTQVNISSSLVFKQPYGSHQYTVVATKHLTFHFTWTNEATLHRECVITLWVSGFPLSFCPQTLPADFLGLCLGSLIRPPAVIELPDWMGLEGLPWLFTAVQMHLHWGSGGPSHGGSEHTINGLSADAEVCRSRKTGPWPVNTADRRPTEGITGFV